MKDRCGTKTITCVRCQKQMVVHSRSNSPAPTCPDCPRTCSVCGEDFEQYRREYRCKRCLAFQQRDRHRTVEGQFTTGRNVAKQRGFLWLLTLEEFRALRSLPCTYCGFPLPETGVGLDRIDNDQGYLVGNVVPCCTVCNLARCNLFSSEEMHIIGRAIAEVKAKRQAEGTQAEPGYARGRKPIY